MGWRPFRLDTHDEAVGLHDRSGSQPAPPLARIKSRMGDDVQRLLHERRYDEALEAMLDLYEHKVFRLAVAILRDAGRAEEITQDVFVKMWRAFPAYDGRASLSTWLYAIARNTCLSAVRAEAYRKTSTLEGVREPSVSAPPPAVDWDRLLSRLPDAQRHAITLFYFEERSITEVAAMLGVPEGTVKSQLHRARRALADMME
jgi:RNA polymerase sigma-70 factor (ECF subfamily)